MADPLLHCEREQLHLSGAIQPQGTLLVVDRDDKIRHAALNVADFLGKTAAEWLGQALPGPLARSLRGLGGEPGSRKVLHAIYEGVGGLLDVAASRGLQGGMAVELMPHIPPEHAALSQGVAKIEIPCDGEGLLENKRRLVESIRDLTGFQRVLYYRFRGDGDGEVLAEARDESVYGSYLGLRFPGSDIPHIARTLYLKNPWRLIPDAAAEPVPLVGQGTEPPDLTWSDLRSVSPVHRVYLANMGVRASLSFPVVVGGTLTALVAAHHSQPAQLSLELTEYAASIVRTHALAIAGYQSQRRMRLLDSLLYRFEGLRSVLQRHGDLIESWPECAQWLMREFDVEGATLCIEEQAVCSGVSFEAEALAVFDAWFCHQQGEFVWFGDSLSRQVPGFPLSQVAGVLALSIGGPTGRGLRLYLTRSEHIHEVAWGGNPDKPVEYHDGALGIAPRRSFEKWIEQRLGYSRGWENEARLLALKLRELLRSELRL